MVPDRQKVGTDGRTDDAKTVSLRLRRGITMKQVYGTPSLFLFQRLKKKKIAQKRKTSTVIYAFSLIISFYAKFPSK